MDFQALIDILQQNSDLEKAQKMEAYMKNRFSFYGIPSPTRKEILKNWKKTHKLSYSEESLKDLFNLFQNYKREATYCALELLIPILKKNAIEKDLAYITQLISTHSWWDTVDLLASTHLGNFLVKYPHCRSKMLEEYNQSGHLWLQRSTLLFQLKYGKQTDEQILFSQCLLYEKSSEFFIKKAIGWALRQYAKVEPEKVYAFVDAHNFSSLSVKEANKHRAK